jgi:hypothetical protein
MPNMSYCRFQNTLGDLKECYETLGEKEISELSEDEQRAARRLIKLCSRIHHDYGSDE